jgi:hypothetical protein
MNGAQNKLRNSVVAQSHRFCSSNFCGITGYKMVGCLSCRYLEIGGKIPKESAVRKNMFLGFLPIEPG